MSDKNELVTKLCYENKNAFTDATDSEKAEIFEFCEGYILRICVIIARHIVFVGLFPNVVHAPKFPVQV